MAVGVKLADVTAVVVPPVAAGALAVSAIATDQPLRQARRLVPFWWSSTSFNPS
jgi:hypothetical protein